MRFKAVATTVISICISPLLFAGATKYSSLEAKLKSDPDNLKLRSALGRSYLIDKKYEKAIKILAPYSNELSNEGLVDLASAYSGVGDSDNEVRVLKAYSENDANHYKAFYLLGVAFKKNKKYNEAVQSLREAIDRAPKHRPSYEALLDVFSETKQNYEKRVLLSEMIKLLGEKKEFLNQLCKIFSDDGYINDAQSVCKKAVSKNSKYPDNHVYLAQTYYNLGNKSAAEKIFRSVGRQYKKSEFVQYAVGDYYLHEKNFSAAARYLQTAVNLNPASQRAQITLALAMFENEQYPEALTHFEKSCKLDKSNETATALKNSAAKLRKINSFSLGEKYDFKAAVCQQ
ncbi:MAG: hypothetical protein A2Z20_10465 [Bdellovibrionales bacterium RBG_16_40_8]|nr:MAG: hypothetical protein A2Z20_10465 [Bdellovibrionales bacterium RBG_16_40_8]